MTHVEGGTRCAFLFTECSRCCWLEKSGSGTYAYDVRMATSKDGGRTWSKPFLLNRDGRKTEHGFVTLALLMARLDEACARSL